MNLNHEFFAILPNKNFLCWTCTKIELELFSYISKMHFFNFKRDLKLETFDHGTFLYKVHELLLITLQYWCRKKEAVILISSWQLQNESRVSWKLCLALFSLRWLKVILGPAKTFNLSGLWMRNIELGDGLISLRMRWSRECWSQIPISYYIRKKGNLKSKCPSDFSKRYVSRNCL